MMTGARPPKKARLCSDQDSHVDATETTEKSKFFSTKGKDTGSKKADTFLFSDDSIDEALLNLPDLDGWHEPAKPRKSIAVFEESKLLTKEASNTSTNASATKDDTISQSTTTEATAENVVESEVQNDDLSTTSSTPITSTLLKFSYNSSQSGDGADTPASAASRAASSIFTPSTAAPSTVASSVALSATQVSAAPKPSSMTPLQLLGARALQRKPSPRLPRSPNRSPERRERKLAQRMVLSSAPVNPSFVPLPKVDLNEIEALSQPVGSEDHIASESEGENEAEAGNVDQENPVNKARPFNISRFAYA